MSKRLNMIKPEMAVHQGKMQDIKNRVRVRRSTAFLRMHSLLAVGDRETLDVSVVLCLCLLQQCGAFQPAEHQELHTRNW